MWNAFSQISEIFLNKNVLSKSNVFCEDFNFPFQPLEYFLVLGIFILLVILGLYYGSHSNLLSISPPPAMQRQKGN